MAVRRKMDWKVPFSEVINDQTGKHTIYVNDHFNCHSTYSYSKEPMTSCPAAIMAAGTSAKGRIFAIGLEA